MFTQLYGFKYSYRFLIIFKLISLTQIGHAVPLWPSVMGVIVLKRISLPSRTSELDPHPLMQFRVIAWEPFFGVCGGLTPSRWCNWCILSSADWTNYVHSAFKTDIATDKPLGDISFFLFIIFNHFWKHISTLLDYFSKFYAITHIDFICMDIWDNCTHQYIVQGIKLSPQLGSFKLSYNV